MNDTQSHWDVGGGSGTGKAQTGIMLMFVQNLDLIFQGKAHFLTNQCLLTLGRLIK